jgi:hypothetical protein
MATNIANFFQQHLTTPELPLYRHCVGARAPVEVA